MQGTHVEQEIRIRYQVAHDGSVFWQESHLIAKNERTTSSGEFVTKTSLDIRDLDTRLDEIDSEIGQAGTVRVQLLVTVSYETDEYAGELTEAVPVRLTDSWYTIEAEPLERTHSTPVTRKVPVPARGPIGYALAGGIGFGLLVVAGAIAISYHRGFDQRRLEQRVDEIRYSEWISTGSLSNSFAGTTVSIDSLEGLIDIAIDTNNRVIHDLDRNVYVVVEDAVVYYYSQDGFRFAAAE
ncbi:DUF5305 family protein [Halomarina litorea]|uniref:DUF5305 family protein n=1 Tax=Halomarina litorea TaxID=2961595 RepID=UPI0020C43B76|nr:DUF5305 family protein [Halomarina sp. BCD28]